jgi:hypothetical protein
MCLGKADMADSVDTVDMADMVHMADMADMATQGITADITAVMAQITMEGAGAGKTACPVGLAATLAVFGVPGTPYSIVFDCPLWPRPFSAQPSANRFF